jgi:hypothetical protein
MDFFDNPGMCNPPEIEHDPGTLVARFIIDGCAIQTEAEARAKLATLGEVVKIEKMAGNVGWVQLKVPAEDDLNGWIDRILALGFKYCSDPSKR